MENYTFNESAVSFDISSLSSNTIVWSTAKKKVIEKMATGRTIMQMKLTDGASHNIK